MTMIFGDYFEIEDSQEYLTIHFSPNRLSIQDRWRNNGLSADFLADYWSTFIPVDDNVAQSKAKHARNIIGYVANELLENAMKFHCTTSSQPISISVHLFPDELIFYMQNCVGEQVAKRFQEYIRVLLSEDIDQLYLRQLESNAQDPNHETSQMGFLTMIHDYQAKIAWKFSRLPEEPPAQQASTMVRLTLQI